MHQAVIQKKIFDNKKHKELNMLSLSERQFEKRLDYTVQEFSQSDNTVKELFHSVEKGLIKGNGHLGTEFKTVTVNSISFSLCPVKPTCYYKEMSRPIYYFPAKTSLSLQGYTLQEEGHSSKLLSYHRGRFEHCYLRPYHIIWALTLIIMFQTNYILLQQ